MKTDWRSWLGKLTPRSLWTDVLSMCDSSLESYVSEFLHLVEGTLDHAMGQVGSRVATSMR